MVFLIVNELFGYYPAVMSLTLASFNYKFIWDDQIIVYQPFFIPAVSALSFFLLVRSYLKKSQIYLAMALLILFLGLNIHYSIASIMPAFMVMSMIIYIRNIRDIRTIPILKKTFLATLPIMMTVVPMYIWLINVLPRSNFKNIRYLYNFDFGSILANFYIETNVALENVLGINFQLWFYITYLIPLVCILVGVFRKKMDKYLLVLYVAMVASSVFLLPFDGFDYKSYDLALYPFYFILLPVIVWKLLIEIFPKQRYFFLGVFMTCQLLYFCYLCTVIGSLPKRGSSYKKIIETITSDIPGFENKSAALVVFKNASKHLFTYANFYYYYEQKINFVEHNDIENETIDWSSLDKDHNKVFYFVCFKQFGFKSWNNFPSDCLIDLPKNVMSLGIMYEQNLSHNDSFVLYKLKKF